MSGSKKLEKDFLMSSDFAISVSNVSKCYEVYRNPRDRLKDFLLPPIFNALTKKKVAFHEEIWALRDISFQVKKGEAVGILGRNGSGKSTLLQIIAGTLEPTSGDVVVSGTVAALLELGSGFNPAFTGVENIYIAGAIRGLSNSEIDKTFEEIAAFADIGDFIGMPLSTYSSGMAMRLAFAVNTCLNPDILIIDEALSVGDAPFQSKCFKRLRTLLDYGTSLLFVSHDKQTVASICNNALWLKGGITADWGSAKEVVKQYERFCWVESGVSLATNQELDIPEISEEIDDQSQSKQKLEQFSFIRDVAQRSGNGDVIIESIEIRNAKREPSLTFCYNDIINFKYRFKLNCDIDSDFVIGLQIKDVRGGTLISLSDSKHIHRLKGLSGDVREYDFSFKSPLVAGQYMALTGIFGFQEGDSNGVAGYDFNRSIIWDLIDDAFVIKINSHKLHIPGPIHLHIEPMLVNCEL